jgi:hypothetical protein
MSIDLDTLKELDESIPIAETQGDVAFFKNCLADGFAFRHATGEIDTRESFLSNLKPGAYGDQELIAVDILSRHRAIVSSLVKMTVQSGTEPSEQSIHNLRLFVRTEQDDAWKLLAWAKEQIAPSDEWLTPADHVYGRTTNQDLDLWKHHASFGGEDKSRMVVLESWLLGFSAVIIGYFATHLIDPPALRFDEPLRASIISGLGFFVSLAAAYVVLVYGGYANKNWAYAVALARRHGWTDLRPESKGFCVPKEYPRDPQISWLRHRLGWLRHRLNWWSWRCATSVKPEKALAPVFEIFFGFAFFSLVVNCVLIVWSLASFRFG